MEQDFGSKCSGGCESGWTLYLEQSMYPSHFIQNHNNVNDFSCKKSSLYKDDEDEDEEEDMSMVSDASSGPPHFQQHECFNNNNNMNSKNGTKKQKIPKDVNLHRKLQDLPSFLDDTASSPIVINNNHLTVPTKKALMEENVIIDYSQGYSTTYFEMV